MSDSAPLPTANAHILVVDDEDSVREGLCWSLRLSGYQVDEAVAGAQALAILRSAQDGRGVFDLMLVDMNMPGMGGVQVMEQARRRQPDLAIIVLTGHATLDSAIAAVKAGASDYLLKPVSISTLQAAVSRALAARAESLRQQRVVALMNQVADVLRPAAEAPPTAGEPAQMLRVGALTLDVEKRVATVDDSPPRSPELTEAEAAILQELMRHPDQVRTCRQLVWATWGYDASEAEAAGTVRSHIFRLRKKIEVDPAHPEFVKTVRGGGYFLVGR